MRTTVQQVCKGSCILLNIPTLFLQERLVYVQAWYCLLCWHKVYLSKYGYMHNLKCLGTTTIKVRYSKSTPFMLCSYAWYGIVVLAIVTSPFWLAKKVSVPSQKKNIFLHESWNNGRLQKWAVENLIAYVPHISQQRAETTVDWENGCRDQWLLKVQWWLCKLCHFNSLIYQIEKNN